MNRKLSPLLTMLLITNICVHSLCATEKPHKLVIGIIVDQLAARTTQVIKPFLTGGIKYLLDNGIHYTQAHHPHAKPSTATGHAALSTGTTARNHGWMNNRWWHDDETITCDKDTAERAAVFSADGLYSFGKSPHTLMVEGVSDQVISNAKPNTKNYFYAISLKSRATIPLASKQGKAIWFDGRTGSFTSSKAYFDTLPDWLTRFNAKLKKRLAQPMRWNLALPDSRAYRNVAQDYDTITSVPRLIGQPIKTTDGTKPYRTFSMTYHADKAVLDCARACLHETIPQLGDGHLVLWVSLSALDKLSHNMGIRSQEARDIIYHADKQLDIFIKHVYTLVKPEDVLFIFTSDHGGLPIPERITLTT